MEGRFPLDTAQFLKLWNQIRSPCPYFLFHTIVPNFLLLITVTVQKNTPKQPSQRCDIIEGNVAPFNIDYVKVVVYRCRLSLLSFKNVKDPIVPPRISCSALIRLDSAGKIALR